MTNPPENYEAVPVRSEGVADAVGGASVPAGSVQYGRPVQDETWTQVTESYSAGGSSDPSPSTTDVAKDEAANVKNTAVDAGKNVAATAKDEAANVAGEAKQQAKGLLSSVTGELQAQAGTQQQNIATQIHALSKELGGMASGSSESGPLTDLAHQAAHKSGEIAHWLENKEPSDVLREIKAFGRRRPVMFLALCGLAGVVAGRLTRGAVAANTSVDSKSAGTDRPNGYAQPALRSGPSASLVDDTSSYEDVRSADTGHSESLDYAVTPGYVASRPDGQLGGAR